MTVILNKLDINNLVELYHLGMSFNDIGFRLGVHSDTIRYHIKRLGLPTDRRIPLETLHPAAELYAAHIAGESILAISERIGVSRPSLMRHFKKHGFATRNMKQAQCVRYAQSTPEHRQAIVQAAHAARRGSTDSLEVRTKRAIGLRNCRIGMFEREIIEHLAGLGIDSVGQHPVDIYNVDIFIHSSAVAVEVYSTHPSRKRMAEIHHRTEHLINSSVNVLSIQCTYPNRVFLLADVCERIITFSEFCSRNKSALGHYGVVRGDGKIPARSSHYLNDYTPVMSF